MTIEDVVQVRRAMVSLDTQLTLLWQGKVHFINGLSHMPDRALLKAHKLKRADRDCVLHRVSLALAEVESAERHKDYLNAIQHEGEPTTAQLDVLNKFLDYRGMSDVEDDGGYYRAVYAEELVALTIVEAQMNQMEEVVHFRDMWSGDGNEDEDGDEDEDADVPFTGLLSPGNS